MDDLAVQNLIDSLSAAVLIADRNRILRRRNAAAVGYFGSGGVGQNIVALVRDPTVLNAFEQVVSNRSAQEFQIELAVPTTTSFRVKIAPMDLNADLIVLAFEDMSHILEARQMRNEFVANVSHELRSPLTALNGFIETLQGAARDDPDAQAHFLKVMEGEAQRMGRLISDLLSLSRLQGSDRVSPDHIVELRNILEHVVRVMEGQARANDNDVIFRMDDAQAFVSGDEDQLIQVFQNLVENAIKYGKVGQPVEIDVSQSGSRYVTVIVSDRGEGIAQSDIPRLTERFYRVDKGRSRDQGGTGLGLAIVKHIVKRHRGQLNIISKLGEGSSFSVVLPIASRH
ncbi:MAG: ATP-binding protein [Pseudomonadota bacterium]